MPARVYSFLGREWSTLAAIVALLDLAEPAVLEPACSASRSLLLADVSGNCGTWRDGGIGLGNSIRRVGRVFEAHHCDSWWASKTRPTLQERPKGSVVNSRIADLGRRKNHIRGS